MNTHSQTISTVIDPSAWQQAMYAFLAEKERRSGSRRTVESYSRMLQHFFGVVGTTPDRATSPEVLSWAHGIGLSGRQSSGASGGWPNLFPLHHPSQIAVNAIWDGNVDRTRYLWGFGYAAALLVFSVTIRARKSR